MTVAVLVLGGAMLLLSVATGVAATADALRHLPLQFRDDLSARYYMARALFDPSLPWPVRRNLALATVTGILGFLSFAAAAALAGHGTLAVLFLLGGGRGGPAVGREGGTAPTQRARRA